MTDKKYQDVDELLSDWAGAHEPTPQRLDELNQRVDEALKARPAAGPPNVSGSGWPRVLLGLAAAIAVVVTVSVWLAGGGDQQKEQRTKLAVVPRDPSPSPDPIERFSQQQRAQKLELLSELDRMFGGKRVWFAETDSDVVLGGDAKSASEIAADSTVAMRLVLAKRPSEGGQWQRVWAADVVSRTDQVVRFLSQDSQQPAASFTSWTHLLPDGLVACDVDLKWDNGVAGQLTDSLLLSPGGTTEGASVKLDGVEYRLFHSVSLLSEAKS